MTEIEVAPTYEVLLDVAWRALPSADEDTAQAIDAIIEGLEVDDAAARGLRTGLHAVTALAGRLSPGQRRSFALIRDPASGFVDALLSTRLSRVVSTAREEYIAAARATEFTEGFDVINRTLVERKLAAGTAVVVHDFTVVDDDGGMPEPALERAIVALFIDGSDVFIEFYLATQNLALFEDMEEYLVAIASGDAAKQPGDPA